MTDVTAQNILNNLIDAANHQQWHLVAVLLLIGAVAGFRKLAPKIHGKFGDWANSDRGGIVTVLIGGMLGALVTPLMAKQQITIGLLIGGFSTAVAAAGGWNIINRLLWPKDPIKVNIPQLDDDKPVEDEVTKPGSKISIVLLPLLLFWSTGCACTTVAHRQDPACVVVNGLIDCSADVGLNAVQELIQEYVNDRASVDWKMVEQRLIDMGVKDGGCVLAYILNSGRMAKSSAKYSDVEAVLTNFKARLHVENVKYCIVRDTGGKVCQ